MVRITISGRPGAGKTSVGKLIAKRLGLRFYSMGDMRGQMAKERGITIEELNKLGEKEGWTDTKVDDYQKELGKKEDNFVFEGRLSFHFIPDSFKVFLDVETFEGAKRIFNDPREDESKKKFVEEVAEAIKERVKSDSLRYKKYYNLDIFDKSQYDFVLDTTHLSIEQVVERVIEGLKKSLKRN